MTDDLLARAAAERALRPETFSYPDDHPVSERRLLARHVFALLDRVEALEKENERLRALLDKPWVKRVSEGME